jgi:hypothetical protein
MRVVATIMLLGIPLCAFAWADGVADEQAVWRLEQVYWQAVKKNDIESYVKLWDARFVGWPGFSARPIEKSKIAEWIAPLHKNAAEIYDYELTREALRAFGDVVVVHYLVHDFMRSATSGKIVRPLDSYRVTHTWQRRGDSWQIITGMSGKQASKSN